MEMNKMISAASVVACVLVPFFATAQEYFVDTNGNDAAEGSAAKPWRTIGRAAKGEKVVVTGADPVRGWTKRPDGLWEKLVAYDTFGGLNPFTDFITGRWFERKGRDHFRTRLIQDGRPLPSPPQRHLWNLARPGAEACNRDGLAQLEALKVVGRRTGTLKR